MPRILLVEDNELNSDMLTRRLEKRGLSITLATNGRLGIEMVPQVSPDLILMDMSLPEMDGWEATRRLKQDPNTKDIPVIGLTAHAMTEDRQRALSAGCDDYDTKPVDMVRLMDKINRHLMEAARRKSGSVSAGQPAALQAAPVQESQMKSTNDATLLIVDDEELNRDMLSRRLERAGFGVRTAASGQEALELIEAQNRFELVLLDSMMPGMTGVELLKLLRATRSSSELPVIMVTALSDSERVVEALNLGANDYITKPIDMPVALARINAQLSRKRAEDALRNQEHKFAFAAESGSAGMWDWDLATDGLSVSERWKAILGLCGRPFGSTSRDWFELIHPDERLSFETRLRDYLVAGVGEFCADFRVVHSDGSLRWVQCRGAAKRDSLGFATRMAGSLNDVTSTKAHDQLTNLPNRLFLQERAASALTLYRRDAAADFAVVFLGLDHFKFINDCLGHAAGDEMLAEIARRLENSLRVNPPHVPFRQGRDLVARIGGDEFAILLDHVSGEAAAIAVAERVRRELGSAVQVEGRELFTTCSAGVAYVSPEHLTAEEILRDAGTALTRAKTLGKNRVAAFDATMRNEAVERMNMERSLKKALERDEFEVYYQPKVRLSDDHLIGFEALVRWNHPERGLMLPGQFLTIAEETGLIVPVGYWILRESCRTIKAWRTEFDWRPPLEVSVNVSMKQFREPDFSERVIALLDEFEIEPGALNLEITESVLMDDVSATLRVLERMKVRGVGFKIDDFGTGYSSLSYLQNLPFDTLKIDRSFVAAMDRDPASASIVEAVVSLARNMGLHIVAEGIETPEQANRLRGVGCDYGQGYLYAKPMTTGHAREFMLARAEKFKLAEPAVIPE